MIGELTFLDHLREQRAGDGRGNEELVRAMLPLMRQVLAVHEDGRIAPLNGTEKIYVDGGRLWFQAIDAALPERAPARVRAVLRPDSKTLDVVDQGAETVDLDLGHVTSETLCVASGTEITRPVFVDHYGSWELEVGHHDALADMFLLGMLFGSLATGLDFTERDELEKFIEHRHRLTRLNPTLHPVLARAIVRLTEVDRHKRIQDLEGVIERLARYRDVDERADTRLDFSEIDGFVHADRSSRRKIIQTVLQSRLFDITRRNRLIWFKTTQAMVDLTIASVPVQLDVGSIRTSELFLWAGPAGKAVASGKPLRLDKYLRLEEQPWIRGALDKIRSEARRSRAEIGFSELRLVIAFLNWHNLREDADERIPSPLLLLPVTLGKTRGVRDSYVLQAQSEIAEVNPVLRHHLASVYGLELPDQVDLGRTDVETFHRVLSAAIQRSEPGVTLHLLTRPQIEIVQQRARQRVEAWRRRSRATGRGLRARHGVEYSYARTNFQPLGLALFRRHVRVDDLLLEDHLKSAVPVVETAEPSDDAGNTPRERVTETSRSVFKVTEHAAGPYDWSFDLTHATLGNFNYRKISLVRDYAQMLEEDDGEEHPSFDRLFSLDARELDTQDFATTEEESRASQASAAHAPIVVLPADPTQAGAVQRAQAGTSFIIQGPPGTGKSQTITNLIADFAARGKRVLFVCQKRAAIDVVYHRLAQLGLDRLSVRIHDAQADKRDFIDDLKVTYESWSDAPGLDVESAETARTQVVRQIEKSVGALERFHGSMTGPVDGGEATVTEVVEACLRDGAGPTLDPESAESIPPHGAWMAHRTSVHEAAQALEEVGASPVFRDLALRHVGRAILEAERPLASLRAGLDTLDALLDDVRTAQSRVRDGATSRDLTEALAFAKALTPLLPDKLDLLDPGTPRSATLAKFGTRRKTAMRALEKARAGTEDWVHPFSPTDTRDALAQARRFEKTFVLFRFLSPGWWRLRSALREAFDFAARRVRPSWTSILEALETEHAAVEAQAALAQEARDTFAFEGALADFLDLVDGLRSDDLRSALEVELRARWTGAPDDVREILAAETSIHALQREAARVFDEGELLSFDDLAACVEETRAAADLLPEVRPALLQVLDAPSEVRHALRTLTLTPTEFDAAVQQTALERTLRENRPLARFSHDTLAKRHAELTTAHDALLTANAELVQARARARFRERLAVCALPAAKLSPEEKQTKRVYNAGRRILEREFEKVMRHRSIRELSHGDTGSVVYDLKPIWLMSPLSISETVPIDEQRFDVVIFDEASQIPVEEAVPAVYRAPQMVVVGDEMQLPPTNFFSAARSTDDLDVEDEAYQEVLYDLEAESFLSHAAARLSSTMLGWHYRSRHEALIRFSNEAFYGGSLRTIPDRRRAGAALPIVVADPSEGDEAARHVLERAVSYHRLEQSPYQRRTNEGEAAYIARLVRGLLKEGGGLTLGVVAFSEAQQGVIERALESLGREDRAFGRALEAEYEREDDGQLVGLFVKNLENVQGDERDIIILSICYGPDAEGHMRMNFGPINKGGGEKRLNVVFSRAKRHMAVVASIDYTAITNEYNDGALCFRRYLQYAEAASLGDEDAAAVVMGALARRRDASPLPTRDADPVRDGIREALDAAGWATDIDRGTSAFRIDLVVAPAEARDWQVAVLIDRPDTYTADALLERHHLRPGVLRAFGWRVVHVLPKEWLAHPRATLNRIRRALEEVASPPETKDDTTVDASPDSAPGDTPENGAV